MPTDSFEMDAPNKAKWWTLRGSRATADGVSEVLSLMKSYHEARIRQSVWMSRLYGNQAAVGPFGVQFSIGQAAIGSRQQSGQVRVNATRSCVDTIQSRVAARIKPRSWWLPKGATSYKTARTAKQLNVFSDGIMLEQKVNHLGVNGMRDGEVWGTGCARVAMEPARTVGKKKTSKLRIEKILESEVWVDEQEAMYGHPRQFHYVRALDRGTVAETWAKENGQLRGLILKESRINADGKPSQKETASELIEVRESWRLADGPDSPGRHVITLSDCTLVDEQWPFDFPPIAFLRYSEPQTGFWGHGLVEALEPLQTQLNYVLLQIQNAQRVAGTFKLLYEMKSGIAPDTFDGTLGPTIPFIGTPPSWLVPPAVPGELYAERDRLLALIHEEAGVSQLSTVGKNELGPNASGAAIRTVLEVQQDRFASLSETYNAFFVDINRICIELVKHAVDSGAISTYEVQIIGPKRGQVVDWAALDFDTNRFHLQAWPVSSLPIEPEGRMAALAEMVQNGQITPRTAKQLQDLPDIDAAMALEDADQSFIESCISKMVDDGIAAYPAKEDNLPLWQEMLKNEIQLAKLGELQEDRINLLRDAMAQAVRFDGEIKAAAMPPPAAPGAGGPAPVLAKPLAPPTSPMLPMAPPAGSPQ